MSVTAHVYVVSFGSIYFYADTTGVRSLLSVTWSNIGKNVHLNKSWM